MATLSPTTEVFYPTSDGKPMAETDLHRQIMFEVIETLRGWYANQPDVYVSGNLMVYYEPGNPRRFRSPDAFVVKGVPNQMRELYKIWEEGKAPDCVIEVTSKTTRSEDEDDKFLIYKNVWKVQEYFLFDPREEYLEPSFQGYRLEQGEYRAIPEIDGQIHSEVLDMILERQGVHLQFRDRKTGREILRPEVQAVREARLETEIMEAKASLAEYKAQEAKSEAEWAKTEAHSLQTKLAETESALNGLKADYLRLLQELETFRQQKNDSSNG